MSKKLIQKRATGMLASDIVLQALINPNKNVDRILKPSSRLHIILSDFSLYEALMCIEPQDKVNFGNLIMLMRNSTYFNSGVHTPMTDKRRKHLRKVAFGGKKK